MAKRVTIEMVDDLDETVGDDVETLDFGLEGVDYQIDLNSTNAARLRAALQPFTSAARRTGGKKKAGGKKKSAKRSDDVGKQRAKNEIRNWAREHGYEIGDRGRISEEIQRAYAAAHSTSRTGTDG